MAVDTSQIAERLHVVRERMHAAGGAGVTLVAVTKGFGAPAVVAAVAAGCADIGESYAQEAAPKLADLHELIEHDPSLAAPRVHFVGHVQTNKVRVVAPWVDVWDSVDRASLVDELARRSPATAVLVQVNTTGEPDKSGVAVDALDELLEVATARGLVVEGLMTMGPTSAEPNATRQAFRLLRRLADERGLPECSMGMSGDLEIAIDEGSTQVRIGTAIFGDRPRRVGHVG